MRAREVLLVAVVLIGLHSAATAEARSLTVAPDAGERKVHRLYGVAPSCGVGISLICAAETVGGGALGLVGDAAEASAGVAADAALGGIVDWAASGAAWLVSAIGKQVERATRPALGSPWFARRYAAMRELALSVSLIFLLLAISHAALRRDLHALARSCLIALPTAMLLTFAAVTLVELGLALTDQLTAAALAGGDRDVREAVADLSGAFKPGAGPGALPGLVLLLGSLLTALLALVVWIELVLREAAVYVAVAFLPLALAGLTWQNTAHWARRLAEWLVAIILAKLAIAVAFAVAGSMLGGARGGSGGLSTVMAGCAVLFIAAASPWVLLRLIPFAEQAAGTLHRSHLHGAASAVPGAAASSLLVRQAMLNSFGAGLGAAGGSARPGPQAWAPIPARRAVEPAPEEVRRG